MTTLRTILFFLLMPVVAYSKPKAEISFIYLNPNQVLYITVIDNVYDGGDETDRYYYIQETLEKVLDETEFPMGYKVGRFGWRIPKEQPELQLFIHKWGNNGLGEIEVRLNASLKESSHGRSRNKLGYFRQVDGGYGIFSASRAVAKYNEVLSKALVKLVFELNEHFEMDLGHFEPDGDVQSLSPIWGMPIEEK
jgi:hypothetical protein